MTYMEFLMDEASTALGPEMTELLAQMRASVDFMLTLVDDLLDTSAIESGKLRLDPKPIDLAPLALIAVSSMRVLAAKRRIHIDFRAEAGLPLVMADAHRLRQVMDNLLSNALKYTESGGAVEMSVDLVLPFVRVSVRDHGPGISPENMHTLLSPFGTTTVRSPSGEKSTGLGLLITKRIIEGHGGKFNLTNASPDGTLAELYFPIHEKSHA
jgi:signal transduction histidine kinase